MRLPGSGLVVTLGELNVLPDYLGRPEEIEAAPLRFIGPLIQSVRSWSVAELGRCTGHRAERHCRGGHCRGGHCRGCCPGHCAIRCSGPSRRPPR